MPINTSPKYMDVDKILCRADFWKCLSKKLKWPWPETHFMLRETCIYCHTETGQSAEHFVLVVDHAAMVSLLQDQKLWCKTCKYCLYDHYTPDECDFCWKNSPFGNG